MKTNNIKLLITGLLICLIWSGCYKDKGNYDYVAINQVAADNISKDYYLQNGDLLEIMPTLKGTLESNPQRFDDTTRYSYAWDAVLENAVKGDTIRLHLATTKDLRYRILLKPGVYTCYYIVTDKQSGVSFQSRFSIHVQTFIQEGWVALCNVNGKTRLDMISYLNNRDTLITDVLTYTNAGFPDQGAPVSISLQDNITGNCYYIFSGNGANKIDLATMRWKSTYDIKYNMMGPIPAGFKPEGYKTVATGMSYLVANGNAYFENTVMGAPGFALPFNRLQGELEEFKVSPYVCGDMLSAVLYDMTNRRFVQHSLFMNKSYCNLLIGNEKLDFNTGNDLLFMLSTYTANRDTYAVMKKPGTNQYFLYRFNINYGSITPIDVTELTGLPGINGAEQFAVSNEYGTLFYSNGGKVYQFDMFTKQSQLMLDLGVSRVSSLLCPMTNGGGDMYRAYNKMLAVCSYNPGLPEGQNGTIAFYTVGGRLEPLQPVKSFSGLGKAIQLVYKK